MVKFTYDANDTRNSIRNGADGFTVSLTFLAPALEGADLQDWLEHAQAVVSELQGTEAIRAHLDVKQVRFDVSEVREREGKKAAIAAVTAKAGSPADAIAEAVMMAYKTAAKNATAKAKTEKAELVARLKKEASDADADAVYNLQHNKTA